MIKSWKISRPTDTNASISNYICYNHHISIYFTHIAPLSLRVCMIDRICGSRINTNNRTGPCDSALHVQGYHGISRIWVCANMSTRYTCATLTAFAWIKVSGGRISCPLDDMTIDNDQNLIYMRLRTGCCDSTSCKSMQIIRSKAEGARCQRD